MQRYYLLIFLAAHIISPYLLKVGGKNIRLGYVVILGLDYLIFLGLIHKNVIQSLRPYKQIIIHLTLFYLGVIFISTVVNTSHLTSESISFLAVFVFYIVSFVLLYTHYFWINNLDREIWGLLTRQVTQVLIFLGVAAVVTALVERFFAPDVIQYLFSTPESVASWGQRVIGGIALGRVGSFFGSPNSFGEFVVLILLLLITKILCQNGRRLLQQIPDVVCFLLVGAGLVLSNSRGGALGFLAGSVFLFAYFRKALPFMALGLLGGLLLVLPHAWIAAQEIADASATLGRPAWPLPAPVADRLWYVQQALGSLSQTPIHYLIGFGPFNEVIVQVTAQWGPVKSTHNAYLSNLYFYGVLGPVLLMFIAYHIVRMNVLNIRYYREKDRGIFFFHLGFLAFTISLLTHSLVDDVFFINTSVMGFYLPLLVLVLILARFRLDERRFAAASEEIR